MRLRVMTWISLWSVAVLGVISPFAAASVDFQLTSRENCTAVDLRTGPLAKEHIRDQDGMGSCYAFAATSVAEYMHRDQLKGRRLSALGTSIQYSIDQSKFGNPDALAIAQGGNVKDTLRLLQNSELCTEDELPSEDRVVRAKYREIYSQLQRLYKLQSEWKAVLDPMLAEVRLSFWDSLVSLFSSSYERNVKIEKIKDELNARRARFYEEQCLPVVENLRVLFPDTPIDAILQIATQATADEMYEKFILERCKKRIKFNKNFSLKAFRYVESATAEKILGYSLFLPFFPAFALLGSEEMHPALAQDNPVQDIHKQLSAQRPLVISMNMNPILKNNIDGNSFHAMVVVGRQWDEKSNSCMLLIRNSWGNSCYSFNPEKVTCENGDIAVSEATIKDTTRGLAWLE